MELLVYQDKPYRTKDYVLNKLFQTFINVSVPKTICTSDSTVKTHIEEDKKQFFLRILYNEQWKPVVVSSEQNEHTLIQLVSNEYENIIKKLQAFKQAAVSSSFEYTAAILHLKSVEIPSNAELQNFQTWLKAQKGIFILRDPFLETPHIILVPKEDAVWFYDTLMELQQQRMVEHLSLLQAGTFLLSTLVKELKPTTADTLMFDISKLSDKIEIVDIDVSNNVFSIFKDYMNSKTILPKLVSTEQMDTPSSSTLAWIFVALLIIVVLVAFGIGISKVAPKKILVN